jgi:hypothetical protein
MQPTYTIHLLCHLVLIHLAALACSIAEPFAVSGAAFVVVAAVRVVVVLSCAHFAVEDVYGDKIYVRFCVGIFCTVVAFSVVGF